MSRRNDVNKSSRDESSPDDLHEILALHTLAIGDYFEYTLPEVLSPVLVELHGVKQAAHLCRQMADALRWLRKNYQRKRGTDPQTQEESRLTNRSSVGIGHRLTRMPRRFGTGEY